MKKFYKLLCVSFALALITANGFAQDLNYCHTDEMVRRSLNAHPELKQAYLAEQARLEALDLKEFATEYKQTASKQMATVYIIPVVFHIIHQNGSENISDAQVIDQVRILNNDYRRLNSDTSGIVTSFKPLAADCEIEFRLAKKDPSGNCTNGIDRIFSPLTNSADDNSKLNPWAVNKYLNIWVVKTIGTAGVAGYAYFPGTAFPSTVDGILILSNYIGSVGSGSVSTSRALTHEIGHYLNLQHTWGNTNNPGVSCGNDAVSDTPVTKGHTTCTLTDATCTAGVVENVQNYMEYAYCSKMFTTGQRTRMRSALTSSTGNRNNLWTATNLTSTGVSTTAVLCKSDFKSSVTTNSVCQGDSLTFTDLAWNGNPTSWTWTFPGGTPSTSTDSIPTIHYNTPGLYDVTLTVGNASGSVTTTKPDFVTVNSNTATFTGAAFYEGFESTTIPSSSWLVHNYSPGGNTWTRTNAASTTGSYSIMINNLSTYGTYIDEFVGPSVDMTTIVGSSPTLNFKVAYAQRTSTSADKLQVYVSTNCGLSWSLRKTILAAALSTGGVVTGNFVPNSTQWSLQSANLIGYISQTNLYYMFRFTSDGGNNIYIDDININGVTTGIDELANSIDFNIYPNPIDENTVIAFNLLEKQDITIKVMDVLGREITTVFDGNLNEGEHQYSIGENSDLSAGIYFVKVTANGRSFSKKMIVK